MKTSEKMYKSFENMAVEEKLDYLHKQLIALKDTVSTGENSVLRRLESMESSQKE